MRPVIYALAVLTSLVLGVVFCIGVGIAAVTVRVTRRLR